MKAVLLGSISTVADTSEIQRRAFNDAFAHAGLDWHWDQQPYRAMLGTSGGEQRIAGYARAHGADVDASALHRRKDRLFAELLGQSGVRARPGVVETLQRARGGGPPVAFVTTTSRDTIDALLAALAPVVRPDDFALITGVDDVDAPKPAPDAYLRACEALGVAPADCVAVEDNPGGVAAARAAGVPCRAFPNENTRGLDFGSLVPIASVTPEALGAGGAA